MITDLKITRTLPSSESWKADLDWTTQAYIQAVTEEINSGPLRGKRSVDSTRIENIHQHLENLLYQTESTFLLIGTKNSQRIGYFIGFIKECLAEIPPRVGYINGLYVEPSYRSQKVGSALYDEALKIFNLWNMPMIELYTALGNSSGKSFWIKRGFVASEEVLVKIQK